MTILDPSHVTGLFLRPLKTFEKHRFSDVFRGCRKRLVTWNGSRFLQPLKIHFSLKSINLIMFIDDFLRYLRCKGHNAYYQLQGHTYLNKYAAEGLCKCACPFSGHQRFKGSDNYYPNYSYFYFQGKPVALVFS